MRLRYNLSTLDHVAKLVACGVWRKSRAHPRPGLFLWGDTTVVPRGRKCKGSKSQQQVRATPSGTSAFLIVMYIAAFVAAFNENIINVALHDIMAAFSVSATTAQWLVSGYMIVTSIFTAIMAFLSGCFSTRKLLFFACGCLVAGEVLCLVAPTFTVLLPSRILQAAGSGILFPLMMNVVLSCAPREKLGLYLSLGGACITLGPAFGPVISGLMCTLFGWRAVFVVPLVGGIAVAAAGVKLVQNVGERSNTTLDILSVVLLAAGITAFVYSVGEFSTNLISGIGTLFAALVLLSLFAARQLKLEHPVLNVRPMASVRFWPACLLVVVSMMTTFSMSVLLPLYFEGACGMTALVASLLILPTIACNAVTSIVGGRVMDGCPWRMAAAAGRFCPDCRGTDCDLDDRGDHEHRRCRGTDRCSVCRRRFGAEPLANGRIGDATRCRASSRNGIAQHVEHDCRVVWPVAVYRPAFEFCSGCRCRRRRDGRCPGDWICGCRARGGCDCRCRVRGVGCVRSPRVVHVALMCAHRFCS